MSTSEMSTSEMSTSEIDAVRDLLRSRPRPVGWAERRACPTGALWVFVFSPKSSALRGELEALAIVARC